MTTKLAAMILVVGGLLGVAISGWGQAEWIRAEKTDPLTNSPFVRFTLDGKFLQAPSKGAGEKPTFVLECDPSKTKWKGTVHGKLLNSFIVIGTTVDSRMITASAGLVKGSVNVSSVPVMYRRDDEHKVQHAELSVSSNFSALALGEGNLFPLFYWHDVIHREGKGEQVRKIVLSVPEYLGGNVVMQFDLPDLTTVADSCGLVEHRR
jgi:hypothetical protein